MRGGERSRRRLGGGKGDDRRFRGTHIAGDLEEWKEKGRGGLREGI